MPFINKRVPNKHATGEPQQEANTHPAGKYKMNPTCCGPVAFAWFSAERGLEVGVRHVGSRCRGNFETIDEVLWRKSGKRRASR